MTTQPSPDTKQQIIDAQSAIIGQLNNTIADLEADIRRIATGHPGPQERICLYFSDGAIRHYWVSRAIIDSIDRFLSFDPAARRGELMIVPHANELEEGDPEEAAQIVNRWHQVSDGDG